MAAPGAIPGVRPAAPKASGTRIDRPSPSATRPVKTTGSVGATITISMPTAARPAQERAITGAPNRAVKGSPTSRPTAMEAATQAAPEAATAAGAPKDWRRYTPLQSYIEPSAVTPQKVTTASASSPRLGMANAAPDDAPWPTLLGSIGREAATTPPSSSGASTRNWVSRLTPNDVSSAVRPPPAMVPRLHRPWSDDRI